MADAHGCAGGCDDLSPDSALADVGHPQTGALDVAVGGPVDPGNLGAALVEGQDHVVAVVASQAGSFAVGGSQGEAWGGPVNGVLNRACAGDQDEMVISAVAPWPLQTTAACRGTGGWPLVRLARTLTCGCAQNWLIPDDSPRRATPPQDGRLCVGMGARSWGPRVASRYLAEAENDRIG